jgi:ubiquinone/menaquinone biosynthesis C-methylase UbiE
MKRVPTEEWLDSDLGTPAEIAASLNDLKTINTKFGGAATTESMIRRIARHTGNKSFSVLEVAAGAGHTPQLVQNHLRPYNIDLQYTLLDRAASHLGNGSSGFSQVSGNALALPFADDSFDLVSCNLFVHHLSPEEVLTFAREGLRVCRTAFLINDLVRSALHLALVYAGTPLYNSRLTRHDAPASVRQAYTPGEILQLLKQTQTDRVEIRRRYLYRMAVIAWKQYA